jgi:4-hydroxy-2-oxoheptanedioate aldolase
MRRVALEHTASKHLWSMSMKTPPNPFKQALQQKTPQVGLWLSLVNPDAAEIAGLAGFDWLVVDGEHAPYDLQSIKTQLQVLAAYPNSHPVVRVPVGDTALIKQFLDVGVRNLLVPMVDTPEQAAQLVQACRYPQADGQGGVRGMAGARASRWGHFEDYFTAANAHICLIVQVESLQALQNLDAIAATPGVDGVFLGPADLSAAMGWVGQPAHPKVQAAIEDGIQRILKAGKAAGVIATDEALARRYLACGASFVAVGVDALLLMRASRDLAARFKGAVSASNGSGGSY